MISLTFTMCVNMTAGTYSSKAAELAHHPPRLQVHWQTFLSHNESSQPKGTNDLGSAHARQPPIHTAGDSLDS